MNRIKVFIIDDSVVARRIVAAAIEASDDMEVVGTAANGRVGLAKLQRLSPDAVVLDVEMPEMDGLETLLELSSEHPHLPVIMFSSLTRQGAETTLEALSRGANDYVTKPVASGIDEAKAEITEQLLPKIRALCEGVHHTGNLPAVPLPPPPAPVASRGSTQVRVVGLGSSTGGPNALAEVVPELSGLGLPILVVQHMPPIFTRLLAERLDSHSSLRVREAESGDPLEANTVYVAPGDHHMVVSEDGSRVVLHRSAPVNSCRPAVDVLFDSLASRFGSQCLAAVLTGMGKDGFEGCRAIRNAGGRVFAQDESTSVVWGMPGYVSRSGVAEATLPLDRIAPAIRKACGCEPGGVG
jgi:two-component system chemotaxis response regulator CheB